MPQAGEETSPSAQVFPEFISCDPLSALRSELLLQFERTKSEGEVVSVKNSSKDHRDLKCHGPEYGGNFIQKARKCFGCKRLSLCFVHRKAQILTAEWIWRKLFSLEG